MDLAVSKSRLKQDWQNCLKECSGEPIFSNHALERLRERAPQMWYKYSPHQLINRIRHAQPISEKKSGNKISISVEFNEIIFVIDLESAVITTVKTKNEIIQDCRYHPSIARKPNRRR